MADPKLLQQTLWDLQKRFGDRVVTTLGTHDLTDTSISTTFPALDAILHTGGIPRGRISTLIGTPTCGATTLALRLLASAQSSTEAGIYLDPAGTFDVGYAALYGVASDRLLLAQPQDAEQALEIARDLVKTDRAALIVIDLQRERRRRTDLTEPLRRLHDLVKLRTAVLFLLDTSLPVLDEFAQTSLHLERVEWLRTPRQVMGYRVRATILKDKPKPPGQTAVIEIVLDPRVEGGAL